MGRDVIILVSDIETLRGQRKEHISKIAKKGSFYVRVEQDDGRPYKTRIEGGDLPSFVERSQFRNNRIYVQPIRRKK
jgi:hypothetical protein